MATGLWTATSGASAQAAHVDTIANNLANSDTLGFKKDMPTFKEYLSTAERENGPPGLAHGPIKEKEFYPLDGRDQAFVVMDGTYTNFRPGALKVTQSPLDLAMDGPGFLEVSTPAGIRYTRQGSLHVATDGRLVTTDGFPVLSAQPGGVAARARIPASETQPGQGGPTTQGGVAVETDPATAARYINVNGGSGNRTNFTVTAEGDVYIGSELAAKLSVVEFRDLNKLKKHGGQLFSNLDPANAQDSLKTTVRQGVLETSNVNPVEEMTNLIKANRLFEHDLKAMKTYGELLGRESNDIGKF